MGDLEEAIERLKIAAVLLSSVTTTPETFLRDEAPMPLSTNYEWMTDGVAQFEERTPEGAFSQYLSSFLFRGTVRLCSVPAEVLDGKPPTPDQVIVTITARFDVRYAHREEVSTAALEAFSKHNVAYHVWPFWRELVHSLTQRMAVGPVMVPQYVVPRSARPEPQAK